MHREEFLTIFENEEFSYEGESTFKGLQIIAKYTDNIVAAAEHDIIYSEDIDVLIENGITSEDVKSLRNLGWMVEDESYLSCFV